MDKSNLLSILKVSYINEMLEQKVRLLVDGLPLSTKGYTQAKHLNVKIWQGE